MRASGVHAALLIAIGVLAGAALAARQTPPSGAPEVTLQQIAAAVDRRDLAAATALVEPALRAHPADPALHNLAGVIKAQSGAYEAAELHFHTAIRLAPGAAAAYENLGRLYQEHAGTDPAIRAKAIHTYRRLIAVDPASVEGLYQAAFLLALDAQFAESRALVDRLPDRIRQRPQALAVLIADLAGLDETQAATRMARQLVAAPELTEADIRAILPALPAGRHPEVIALMLEGLDRRGLASTDSLRHLAAVYSVQGRFADARALLERVATQGVTAPLLLELARAAVKLKDYQGALGYLAHARALDPDNATVHFAFGMVCV